MEAENPMSQALLRTSTIRRLRSVRCISLRIFKSDEKSTSVQAY